MHKQPRVVNGILLMCLNIGITPPDVSKPKKCAVMEAWTDPFAQSPKKSLEIIGLLHTHQHTYTRRGRSEQRVTMM